MNDNAVAAGSVRAVLSGLPQRLVQDGLVDETAMLDAIAGARERKTHLVSWLVSHDMAAARDIAIAAAQEFGMPLLDLDAVSLDLDVVRLVSDKLLAKHRILPLVKRGKRLHVAVSDPQRSGRTRADHARNAGAQRDACDAVAQEPYRADRRPRCQIAGRPGTPRSAADCQRQGSGMTGADAARIKRCNRTFGHS